MILQKHKCEEKIFFRPVIPLLLAMIGGILLAEKLPGEITLAVIVMCGAFVGSVFLYLRQKPSMLLSMVLFFTGGYLALQPWVSPRFPSDHVIHFTDGRSYKIAGIIDRTPVMRPTGTQIMLRMKSIWRQGKPRSVCGRIRVTIAGEDVGLSNGDEIVFFSKIKSIRNFNNPGAFDYRRSMVFKRVWGRAFSQSKNILIHSSANAGRRAPILHQYRSKISDLIKRSALRNNEKKNEVTAVLKALLLGDKSQITPPLREAFNRAGVSHLLAISGLHVGIVAFASFLIFRWAVIPIRPLLWAGWVKKTAALLSFTPVLLYGFLSGMSPSTQRAVVMVSVFLLTFLVDRDQDVMNTIAVAAMVILVLHPPSLFSISFQLSFSAVLSIVYGLSHSKTALRTGDGKASDALKKLGAMALVTVFATIGTAPIVAYYFNQISLIGLFSNIIMVPVIGFLVVPLGLASVFIFLISAKAALGCIGLCGFIVDKAIRMTFYFSDLPWASVKTVTPSIVELCLVYLLLWGVFNWIVIKHPVDEKRRSMVFHRFTMPVVVVVIAAIGLSADVFYWLHTRFWHRDLRVTVLDVGQGSAALLELPGGHNLLIDGGGFSDNRIFDTGALIVAPVLWRKKIKTIDTILLSHANSDHLNGLIYIAEHFNVKQAITNNEPSPAKGFVQFLEVLRANSIDHPSFDRLERTMSINGVRLQILHPEADFIQKTRRETWRNLNNNSLVVRIVFGKHSFLFSGDIMAMAESALVGAHKKRLKSDVLLVPHHGSDSSSTSLFLSRVDPEVAIISAGWKNRFNFPSEKVLARLGQTGSRIYRTDIHGAVRIWTDGEHMKVRSLLPSS